MWHFRFPAPPPPGPPPRVSCLIWIGLTLLGLKWDPAALQPSPRFPSMWTWNPWFPGSSPKISPLIKTPSSFWAKVSVPVTTPPRPDETSSARARRLNPIPAAGLEISAGSCTMTIWSNHRRIQNLQGSHANLFILMNNFSDFHKFKFHKSQFGSPGANSIKEIMS